MNSPETTTFTESDAEWTVEDFTRRAAWTDETTECANCGSAVKLNATHYYVTLHSRRSTDLSEGSREVVFCSRS